MTKVLQIGNLKLDMGSMSHVLSVPTNEKDLTKFYQYITYQTKFA